MLEESMGDFFISTDDLRALVGGPFAPTILDVRKRDAFDRAAHVLPTARWRDHTQAETWADSLPSGASVVLYCVHGHQVSQAAAAVLRERGILAQVLRGGYDAWQGGGAPVVAKAALPGRNDGSPSRWVTRVRPKIDRIACPWLIRRFVDPDARFYFVEPSQVIAAARELRAIPDDVEGVEFTHDGPLCTFDTLLSRFGLVDKALGELALIVRGADTGRFDAAPEAAGLLAVSLGVSALSGADDKAALARGMPIYDALYAWRRQVADEVHAWPPAR
jgi:rhodanese-related sulfurtransferase